LHALPHAVLLPRLELFADAGYPFTQWPDLARAAVILPRTPTPVDYETILDFAGFAGAQTGAIAARLTVSDSEHLADVRDKDLILIGSQGAQPLLSNWAGEMPLTLSGTTMKVNDANESTLLLHPQWPFRRDDSNRLRRAISDGAGAEVFVESFLSPLHENREVVAIIPSGPNAIEAVRALFTPSEREGPVYGGVSISRDGRFESFLVGTAAYHAGEVDRYQYTQVFLIENYWLIPLILLLLALFVVAWVRCSTERVAAERLATWET
jgi:cellulose synthase (UDP-forming)